jgi:polyisoprenoid-binding protein YceI
MNAFGQTWSLDKGHSKIAFTVTHHMISEVDGYFRKFDAHMTATKDDFSDAVLEMTAETASINTENERRDTDLKGENFFDVVNKPTMTFKSTSFKKVGNAKYKMDGNLTIKGITKPVSFDVTMIGPEPNPNNKKPAVGMKAVGTINRKDFGLGASMPSALVSEEVQLKATGELQKN